MIRKAFITGSQAYGSPHERSDVDLVVLVDDITHEMLYDLKDDGKSVRFGRLNLILCETKEQYDIWRRGTDDLIRRRQVKRKPVSRDEAVEHFQSIGISNNPSD